MQAVHFHVMEVMLDVAGHSAASFFGRHQRLT
jgi:hypothetical protein